MVDIDLVNIRQVNNLSSGKFTPFVGLIFISMVVMVSLGLTAQETIAPRHDEVTVFGAENRSATLHRFSSNFLKHLQNNANQEAFNSLKQMSPAVSLVATGKVLIQDERPNGLYQKYHDFSDTISMVIMAETLIIHSMMVKSGSLVS